uniref:MHD domain-containing protein n=1 Tax=Triticum urartu TaxID=4572 RepID=A0A8R7TPZ7_TRIUA
MDFGYPQNLSPKFLKLYITQERVRSPFSSKPSDKPVLNATLQVIGVVGWRRDGIVYKKNEVFLDIIESINLLMSSKGILWTIKFYLSGLRFLVSFLFSYLMSIVYISYISAGRVL